MVKRVAVVVLNWNGWKDTISCVESLRQLDYPNFWLIVVDNASTDDSVTRIKQALPDVELMQTTENLGFGGGCNAGIRRALDDGADYVWLVNSDAVAEKAALSALVQVAEENEALGSVGSVLYEYGQAGKVQLWGGGRVNLWTGQSRHQLVSGWPDFISGASLFLRRAALEEVGLFDQKTFFMYWEDTDIHFRLRKAGWRLAVAADSRLWHKQSASLGKKSPLLDQYFVQSAVRFFKRHAPYPFIPISLMLTRMLARRVLRGQFKRSRAVLKGFLAA